jgi:hypothetical protein
MREVWVFLRAHGCSSQIRSDQLFADEGRRELARLPTACGGFGLRSIADHCGIAFVAATVAAHELFPALLSQRTRDQLARSKVEMLFESNFLQKESFWFRCSVSSK